MRPVTLVGLFLLALAVLWAVTAIPCAAYDIALIASQPLGGDPIPGDDPIPDSSPGSPGLLGGDPIPGDDPIPDGLTPHP